MTISKLEKRPSADTSQKIVKRYKNLSDLLAAVRNRELPEKVEAYINSEIKYLNEFDGTDKKWSQKLRKSFNKIINRLARKAKLTPRNYHRNQWIGIGMAAFGAPIGVAFGFGLENMAFMGLGLPIGLSIGIAVGTAKDKKAKEDGRQLDIDMNI